MKLISGISRGAIGLALAACLCAGASVSARAHEHFFGHRPVIVPVPLPLPLPGGRPSCGWGYHRIVVRDAYGYVVERCVPDYYRR